MKLHWIFLMVCLSWSSLVSMQCFIVSLVWCFFRWGSTVISLINQVEESKKGIKNTSYRLQLCVCFWRCVGLCCTSQSSSLRAGQMPPKEQIRDKIPLKWNLTNLPRRVTQLNMQNQSITLRWGCHRSSDVDSLQSGESHIYMHPTILIMHNLFLTLNTKTTWSF